MSRKNALLVAGVVIAVLAGPLVWPEPARADFEAAGRVGGGSGHAGIAGRVDYRGGGTRAGVSFAAGDVTRFGAIRSRGAHARRGARLGDRFRVQQHERIAGRKLPSAVHLGDVYRVAQRERLKEGYFDRARDHHRRAARRHGRAWRWLHPEPYYPFWAPGVPDDDAATIIVVQVPAAAPAAPGVPADETAEPLDPRGRVTVVGVDGGADAGIVDNWSQGDVLPDDVPHVTLDHVAYGLPAPPLGEKYARVGNDVLRINTGTRRVVEVVAR